MELSLFRRVVGLEVLMSYALNTKYMVKLKNLVFDILVLYDELSKGKQSVNAR